MMLAGEQLFAERGFRGVSLREIGLAAGQRNNSAAQYHFGSRLGERVERSDVRLRYGDRAGAGLAAGVAFAFCDGVR